MINKNIIPKFGRMYFGMDSTLLLSFVAWIFFCIFCLMVAYKNIPASKLVLHLRLFESNCRWHQLMARFFFFMRPIILP